MYKRLQAEFRHGFTYDADIVEGVFAREHDALDAEPLHHLCACSVVHRHLRAAVDLERRIQLADKTHRAKILYDGRVDAAIDALAEVTHRFDQFTGLDQHVEGQINPCTMLVRDGAGLRQFVERELGALIARVVHRRTEIHRVRTIGHGSADGVECASGGEEFRDVAQ